VDYKPLLDQMNKNKLNRNDIQPWHLSVGIVKTALKKDKTAHLWGKI
jgi:hypothetical protein